MLLLLLGLVLRLWLVELLVLLLSRGWVLLSLGLRFRGVWAHGLEKRGRVSSEVLLLLQLLCLVLLLLLLLEQMLLLLL